MTEVMRKVFRTIFALAVAGAALSACKKEILEGKQALASVEAFETQGGNTSYRLNFIDV